MRFIHTSDWHLGRIFHGLHLTEDQSFVLDELVALAREAKSEAVLIAGDIYDRAVPPTDAVALMNEVLCRLIYEAGQNVILIAGNHDSGQRLGFARNLLAHHRLFISGPLADTEPVVLQDASGPVYFAPLTYGEPYAASAVFGCPLKTHEDVLQEQIRRQLAHIPAAGRKVALAHVFLAGAQESADSERPLCIGGSAAVSSACFAPFAYAALGHLHACQGSGSIRYSGSLLKYSFNEAGQKKGVQIVDLAADGRVNVETVQLHPRFDLCCLSGSFEELLRAPRQAAANNYVQITLTDDHPILDAKYRLEQAYPHILHLQYRQTAAPGTADAQGTRAAISPDGLFREFFTQMQGRSLSAAEGRLLQDVLRRAAGEEAEDETP